ncbi:MULTISPECIES: DMT family transporter [unclassified Halomonas]|uniref:DMT family transporter n=1 Tax=unclassified Halomonas TaxID=2609666 RepID=UPI001C9822AC|nr:MULTISPECIES: DMT family transporter [unclassified Halomonas]MBY5927225.1 DMT family transporter [Halomonas sp. DP4Y7-2]MBY6234267.1 DMT family transporter [Halomonas sp. DP4Y7-1]
MSSSLIQVAPLVASPRRALSGVAAALGAVLIWSCYFLSLRQGALSPLGTLDLTLFRYAVPGLVLLPLALRRRQRLLAVNPVWLVGMMAGAGIPFFLLGAVGMGLAPVAHGSTLIPGAAPLFVSTLAVWVFAQPLSRGRAAGLVAIAMGIACLLASSGQGSQSLLLGQGMFLLSSVMWAVFTLSVRQSGLSALEATAVVTVPSGSIIALTVVALEVSGVGGLTLHLVSAQEWLGQLVVQGILVGLGSGLLMGIAIRRLGAEATSALGSLTPVVATALAWWALDETIGGITAVGMLMVVFGVMIASRGR